jgi:hypothetical protein
MKLILLISILSSLAFSAEKLKISKKIWYPEMNKVKISDFSGITTALYEITPTQDLDLFITHGNRGAFGCDISTPTVEFTLQAIDSNGEVIEEETLLLRDDFILIQSQTYNVKVSISNLETCSGYTYNFLAVNNGEENL